MVNLIKTLQFILIFLVINSGTLALTSSSFLISQSAFNNYDYSSTLFKFNHILLSCFKNQLPQKMFENFLAHNEPVVATRLP